MKPWPHQLEVCEQAVDIIRRHMLVYIAMEERTGKSLTSLLVAEELKVNKVLILTKKKALDDWLDLLDKADLKKTYVATNYHSAWQIEDDFDLVILDESHNYLSAYPKIGSTQTHLAALKRQGKPNRNIYDAAKRLCKDKPIIYLSATPYAQGPQLLYHQLSLSSWSPWRKYPNFYSWFRTYGKPYTIELRGRQVNQYDRCNVDLTLGSVEHLFITKTRTELSFTHEPSDRLHWIELSEATRDLYNELMQDDMVFLDEWPHPLVCDTTAKLRASLHMLEGGTAKIENNYVVLGNTEKIDYIFKTWGDHDNMAIMYNYKAELIKLQDTFEHALILQATSYAEGIDLSHIDTLIIYSQDFSTARHTQRRARQCNLNRDTPIDIHYLLAKKALSHQVYNTVSRNKRNFVDSVFVKEMI